MSRRVFVCGDTHGPLDIRKLDVFAEREPNLTKEDFLIIAGDFGGIWTPYSDDAEKKLLAKYDSYPWTTLFIDGNHENFERLYSQFPVIFNPALSGNVRHISNSVIHLQRGGVYDIAGNVIFAFGGGISIDKHTRERGTSWWPEELPTYGEMSVGFENVKEVHEEGKAIDFVISHTCPEDVYERLLLLYLGNGNYEVAQEEKGLRSFLSTIASLTPERKGWFFGHFHLDTNIHMGSEQFTCLYNRLPIEISKWA